MRQAVDVGTDTVRAVARGEDVNVKTIGRDLLTNTLMAGAKAAGANGKNGIADRGTGRTDSSQSSYVNIASENRTNHILYGDKTGGSHLYPGNEGKSTFPQKWSAEKTMHEISDVATDPGLTWNRNRVVNGVQRYDVTGIRDGVEIKVITDGKDIITAFPIGGR